MRFNGTDGAHLIVNVADGKPEVAFTIKDASEPGYSESFTFDENHATALALALQAAVAEIQARAVSR